MAIGPPLAAVVTENFDWHTMFWASAALGMLDLLLVLWIVPESAVRSRGRFDVPGTPPRTIGQGPTLGLPRSGPYADQPPAAWPNRGRFRWSAAARSVHHQHTKNLPVSYSPKKLGFF
ncbi:hypothetical protein [Streptomyces sp. NPDC008122]|uniref:hypothetical protein n=1 Tax=Streptomyces sp. NPDC008122 TaxID=3364810 RepID=UPI0036EF6D7B